MAMIQGRASRIVNKPRLRGVLLMLWLLLVASIPSSLPDNLPYRAYLVVQQDIFVPLAWMADALRYLPAAPLQSAAFDTEVSAVERDFAARQDLQRLQQQIIGNYATTGQVDPALLEARQQALEEIQALDPATNRILARQTQQELFAQGIGLRFDRVFPPVNFRFTALPRVLVISPRDRIARALTVTLQGDMPLTEVERVEGDVTRLGYSALVVPIGGLGTYPSMIPPDIDLSHSLRTIAHEWAHHYLAFRPLGWRYALGVEKDDQVVTINETAADIIGNEIGRRVQALYYGGPSDEDESPEAGEIDADTAEFGRLMRETHQAVEQMLAAGRVDEAERYMEQQRLFLNDRGYRIRKLNQAYFAFYGSYSDQPGFVSPVGEALRRLRAGSGSLADFAQRVSAMSSFTELERAVAGMP